MIEEKNLSKTDRLHIVWRLVNGLMAEGVYLPGVINEIECAIKREEE